MFHVILNDSKDMEVPKEYSNACQTNKMELAANISKAESR